MNIDYSSNNEKKIIPSCENNNNKLNEIENKINLISNKIDLINFETNDNNQTNTTNNLIKSRELKKKIQEENNKYSYISTPEEETSNIDNKKYLREKSDIDNFSFKPNYNFKHNEPNNTFAKQYGWSYMPPYTWSVPQKRPPVCIPTKNKESIVTPIFDKGTPVDALDWVKSEDVFSNDKYTEQYNENYYYPGWKI